MKRRLFNFITVVSLLLCIGTCGMWVRSHSACDYVVWRAIDASRILGSVEGGINVKWYAELPTEADTLGFEFVQAGPYYAIVNEAHLMRLRPESTYTTQAIAGFEYRAFSRGGSVRFVNVTMPYWAIAFATAFIPVVRLTRIVKSFLQQRKLDRRGLCTSCGYDLRATPDASDALFDRCPECGEFRAK